MPQPGLDRDSGARRFALVERDQGPARARTRAAGWLEGIAACSVDARADHRQGDARSPQLEQTFGDVEGPHALSVAR
jgi:hypothetical protein